MANMFYNSKFDGDISKWDVYRYINTGGMFGNSTLEKKILLNDTNNTFGIILDTHFNSVTIKLKR